MRFLRGETADSGFRQEDLSQKTRRGSLRPQSGEAALFPSWRLKHNTNASMPERPEPACGPPNAEGGKTGARRPSARATKQSARSFAQLRGFVSRKACQSSATLALAVAPSQSQRVFMGPVERHWFDTAPLTRRLIPRRLNRNEPNDPSALLGDIWAARSAGGPADGRTEPAGPSGTARLNRESARSLQRLVFAAPKPAASRAARSAGRNARKALCAAASSLAAFDRRSLVNLRADEPRYSRFTDRVDNPATLLKSSALA
jgi:hypothetical protein